jgi:N-acetylneuraminic acid mutarotase
MTNMLSPRYDVALATANDKIYTISTTNEAYDPVADTWQIKAPLLNGVAHLDAVAVDGKIYVFSAEKPELMNRNIMYNPQTNNWIGRAPIPTPRLFNKAAVVNNKIYVMGGVGVDRNNRLGPAVHVVEVYDLATDSWEIKNPLPDSTFLIEGAVVIKNYIFVLGVVQGSHLMDCQSTPKVYYYNVQTDEWYRTTDLPGNSFSSSGITSIDNQIYVIGGHDSNFKQCNDVFIGEVVIDTSIGGK